MEKPRWQQHLDVCIWAQTKEPGVGFFAIKDARYEPPLVKVQCACGKKLSVGRSTYEEVTAEIEKQRQAGYPGVKLCEKQKTDDMRALFENAILDLNEGKSAQSVFEAVVATGNSWLSLVQSDVERHIYGVIKEYHKNTGREPAHLYLGAKQLSELVQRGRPVLTERGRRVFYYGSPSDKLKRLELHKAESLNTVFVSS